MDIFDNIFANNRTNVVVRMVIKSLGIIRYVKIIKSKILVVQAKSKQSRYNTIKQRHDKAGKPVVLKLSDTISKKKIILCTKNQFFSKKTM